MWGSMMYGEGWGPAWGWMAVGHVLWWLLLAVAIFALLRWTLAHHRPGAGAPDRALALLRERYARGEIDKQEFDARRRDLGG